MNKRSKWILIIALVAVFTQTAIFLYAQGVSVPPRAGTYTVNRASVNSATVPVSVIAPGFMSSWDIHASTACTKPIDCFPYTTAAVPTGVPTASALREIDPGTSFNDNISYFDPRGNYYRFGMGSGWGCVFEAGGATCNVDGTSR